MFTVLGASLAWAQGRMDVNEDLGGLKVEVTSGWIGNRAWVRLQNTDIFPVFCTAEFRNGPESRTRRATVEPGKESLLTFAARREVVRMRVNLTCSLPPHEKDLTQRDEEQQD